MSSSELHNIFKNQREELLAFLKVNCKYDYLKELLINIELEQQDSIYDLFLCTSGLESNKQKAIYELPTEELLTVIKLICDCNNIKNIQEIAAGQGLVAAMLNYYLGNDYIIEASDGRRYINTSHKKTYYPVTTKLFLEYCLDNNATFDGKLLIISWVPSNDSRDLIKLLEIKKPEHVIIIGCPLDKQLYSVKLHLKTLGYFGASIPVKQLCYRDYYKNNKYFPTNSCRSSLLYMTKDQDNLNKILLTIKLKYDNCLCTKIETVSDKIILQDIIHRSIKNTYLIDEMNNNNKFKKITKYCAIVMKEQFEVPVYLKKYKEFVFWLEKTMENKYPLNIDSREKFKEYKNYIQMLLAGQVDILIEKGIIPDWINGATEAEKFIWLDFSHYEKKWKENEYIFHRTFNNLYTSSGYPNSFVNFTGLINPVL